MFGYVLPEKPELKIKEYELFRSCYCGICKSIGRRSGQFKRLLLNYDCTFLAILLTAVAGENITVRKERCIAHPLKKRNIACKNPFIEYASDINILLAYYNMKDDWTDERSMISRSAMLMLSGAYKKLYSKYREKCDIIELKLTELSALEKEQCVSIDRAAEPFARIMEEVLAFAPACRNEGDMKILRWMGYNMGKWIYIIDAFDDIEKDMKKNAYNPVICQYGNADRNVAELRDKARERVEFNLTSCLSQLSRAFELLSVKSNKGLLENIIYMGMLRKTEQITGTRSCERH